VTPVELPVGYYRDSFLLLLDHGDSLYADLLGAEEKAFSSAFRSCSLPAQRLYVRLISRRGPFFRTDRLQYAEIGDVTAAGGELQAAGLLAVDRPGDLRAAVALLRRDELLNVLAEAGGGRAAQSVRVPELIERCLTALPPDRILRELRARFRVLEPLALRAISTYRLLFFGNLWQDLTEFVLSDLGLVRYEAYSIQPEDRLFASAESVQNTLLLYELSARCRNAVEMDDPAALAEIVARLPAREAAEPAGRLRDDILATVGRHLERVGDAERALEVYRLAETPPVRERQARILDRIGRREEALAVCRRIQEEPADEEELQFADRFSPRLERKLGIHAGRQERPPPLPTDVLRLSWSEDTAVEAAVLEHYQSLHWQGYHTENELWNALFGLAFWDIVFLSVPGVFYNRFQRGPRDLFSPRFRHRRAEAVQRRLAEIRGSQTWADRVRGAYDRCAGIANALVAWDRLPVDLLDAALTNVPREHIALILDRMAENLGVHRAGFPDLVLFPPSGAEPRVGYQLVEVKGPGDQLRPNQERWLRFFSEHGIPARVVRVERLVSAEGSARVERE